VITFTKIRSTATGAYSADVHYHGARLGQVENAGQGGQSIMRWLPIVSREVREAVEKSLVETARKIAEKHRMDLSEWFLSEPAECWPLLVEDAADRKRVIASLARAMKDKVVAVRPGSKPGEYVTIRSTVAAVQAKNPTYVILNTMGSESEWLAAIGVA
jgi:hypothetical protein